MQFQYPPGFRKFMRFLNANQRQLVIGITLIMMAFANVAHTARDALNTGNFRAIDSMVMIAAGHAFLDGKSPYVPADLDVAYREAFGVERPSHQIFAYPPMSAVLLMPLARTGRFALGIYDGLNVLALSLAITLPIIAYSRRKRVALLSATTSGAALVASLCWPAWLNLWIGQTALPLVLVLEVLWLLPREPRYRVLRVLCISLLTIKPSLSLVMLAFLAVTDFADVGMAGALTVFILLFVSWFGHNPMLMQQWMESVRDYGTFAVNQPTALASLHNLFGRLGIAPHLFTAFGLVVGAGLGWLAKRERDVRAPRWALLVVAVSLACLPVHDSDLVIVVWFVGLLLFVERARWFWFAPGLLLLLQAERISSLLLRSGALAALDVPFVAATGSLLLTIAAVVTLRERASASDHLAIAT